MISIQVDGKNKKLSIAQKNSDKPVKQRSTLLSKNEKTRTVQTHTGIFNMLCSKEKNFINIILILYFWIKSFQQNIKKQNNSSLQAKKRSTDQNMVFFSLRINENFCFDTILIEISRSMFYQIIKFETKLSIRSILRIHEIMWKLITDRIFRIKILHIRKMLSNFNRNEKYWPFVFKINCFWQKMFVDNNVFSKLKIFLKKIDGYKFSFFLQSFPSMEIKLFQDKNNHNFVYFGIKRYSPIKFLGFRIENKLLNFSNAKYIFCTLDKKMLTIMFKFRY